MSQTVASRLCLWKIPLDGQRWGLPDLTPQMSDCCRQHPCRRINGKNSKHKNISFKMIYFRTKLCTGLQQYQSNKATNLSTTISATKKYICTTTTTIRSSSNTISNILQSTSATTISTSVSTTSSTTAESITCSNSTSNSTIPTCRDIRASSITRSNC